MKMQIEILVGGAAGQGMETVMHLLGKTLLREGFLFISTKDYMSRVRGGHNFSRLRIAETTPWSCSDSVDIMVALNEETYLLHNEELTREGKVIYDPNLFSLPEGEDRGVPVPLKELAKEAGNVLMANAVAVGALLVMLGLKTAKVERILAESFKGRDEIIRGNIKALQAGHDKAADFCGACFTLPQANPGGKRLFIDGNQVLGMAALASGCRFMSAYPMTPATGVMTYLAGKTAEHDVVVEQAEDEIAAINMALGASYAGARSMTATSGGGFSLMVEGLSLAGMTETPLVIVVAMRPGPATGLPTRTEQGDLEFAIRGGHGEFPRAVMSATTLEDAFYRLNKAFELADKYQVPVIFLSDQNFADTHRSVESFDFSKLAYNRYLMQDEFGDRPYQRYRLTESGISPRALPGQHAEQLVLADSDEHDEKGNITEDGKTRNLMMEKRLKKMTFLAAEMDEPEFYGSPEADILLIGWGSTYGSLREAVDLLLQENYNVALLHFSDLWPLPQGRLMEHVNRKVKSICVENNATGQLAGLIRQQTGFNVDHRVLKYDGRPFSPAEIVEEVKRHV